MATAKELFQQGELAAAMAQLISEVKAKPTDTSARIFLFELLCCAGEWDRAERQLDVIATQGAQTELGVMAYRNCLNAERERRKLWAEGAEPHFLADPPTYVERHLDAIGRARAGKFAEAREVLDQAEEERPALPGTADGAAFYDWRDADDFIAPVLEVAVKDQYTWIPWEQVRRLQIGQPEQLRDLIFTPVRVELIDGMQGQFFMLALYAATTEAANEQAKLGRATEWQAFSEDLARGIGARLWMVGDDDKLVFDVESVEFQAVAENEEPSE
ncbi:MAG TPA: type VI secretion system accessory protein TagJ [Blastocatellia bacterium]|nr:type VI secretion system accessory protein TagJ [Blastocatellia bacterium]